MVDIRFTVNGKEVSARVDGELTLLHYLREHLGLMGVKNGCSQGACGTCTVLVNGQPQKTCVIKLKHPSPQGRPLKPSRGWPVMTAPCIPFRRPSLTPGPCNAGFAVPE